MHNIDSILYLHLVEYDYWYDKILGTYFILISYQKECGIYYLNILKCLLFSYFIQLLSTIDNQLYSYQKHQIKITDF